MKHLHHLSSTPLLAVVLASLRTVSVHAQAPPAAEPDPAIKTEPAELRSPGPPSETSPPPPQEEVREDDWWDPRWRHVQPWEAVAVPLTWAAALTLRFAVPLPKDTWKGGIIFDKPVQDAISIRSPSARKAIDIVGDIGFYGMVGYRLIDDLAVAGAGHGRWGLALELLTMDLEAYSVIGLIVWSAQLAAPRQRPDKYYCERDPRYRNEINPECTQPSDNRSFISGHLAGSVAGAALTCMHHSRFPLYGGWGDDVACAATIGLSAATLVSRAGQDRHWPTDIVLGTALGLGGALVPYLLHYHSSEPERPKATASAGPQIRPWVIPTFGNQQGGIRAGLTW